MKDEFLRVAAATPEIRVADCHFNAENIIRLAKEADENGASVTVFPELCITAYTCSDLFLHETLLDGAKEALTQIAKASERLETLLAVGLPIKKDGALYNCAAIIHRGRILGLVPKKNIPNYSEFYEARHFSSGISKGEIEIGGEKVFLGHDVIFCCENMPELKIGFELCEDLWVPNSPSTRLACLGATLICNLSASDEVIGKADFRRNLVSMQSAKLIAGYVYADAGWGESSTDMVFAGHNLICENGTVLAESELFQTGLVFADIDFSRICHERRRTTTFPNFCEEVEKIPFKLKIKDLDLQRKFPQTPFVPTGKKDLEVRCEEILSIQARGLAKRISHTNAKTAVIGLSGGLDSTLALIACVHAFDILGRDRKGIVCVTMPCFGTTSRTKNNALELAKAYGTDFAEINISKAVHQHFEDIGQDFNNHDVTFENSQARERTQVLMDIANKTGGLVVGTGDLSELALGWATYNGDHMSMYAVNASIPKTLVRHLVSYEAGKSEETLKKVLLDILDTPVSPELLPPDENGKISQKTEELVGPYELHDFFLYYFMRFGYPPKKILRIAKLAFADKYDETEIKKWLGIFVRRFFAQQFKRSCLPDGPKVGTVALSPRGDFRMPSDACARLWLEELESL